MSLPKEPRQKMINLMYLVLTALLALNVSSEVIRAFETINKSLGVANKAIYSKNDIVYKNFEEKVAKPEMRDKALIWQPRALAVKKLSSDIYDYIESVKDILIKDPDAGYRVDKKGKADYSKDNLDVSTRILVEGEKGKEFFTRLKAYRDAMIATLNPEEFNKPGDELIRTDLTETKQRFQTNFPLDLELPDSSLNKSWMATYFRMTPIIAAVTMLSKLQNDVRNAESQFIDYYFSKVGQVVLVYDEFKALTSQNSEYLLPGQELVINAGVGAYSKEAAPQITIDGNNIPMNQDGVGEYKTIVPNTSGNFVKKVTISFKKPNGELATVDREVHYVVGVPAGLSISTDKTRVFYLGLQNPLSVVGGGGDEKVSVNVEGPGVSLKKSGAGSYIVEIAGQNTGYATVTASDGKSSQKISIPIKRVPNPLATIGDKAGGEMALNVFKAQKGVAATLKDFIFEGVKYDVISYTMIFTGKGFEEEGLVSVEVSGPYFSQEAIEKLKQAQQGTNVTIDEIKVQGPGGRTILEQNMSFFLN